MSKNRKPIIIFLVPLLITTVACTATPGYTDTAPIETKTAPYTAPTPTRKPDYPPTATPAPTISPELETEIQQYYAECLDPEKCINAMVEHGFRYDLEAYNERFGNTSIPSIEEIWSQPPGDRVCQCTICGLVLGDGLAQHGYPRTFLSLDAKDPQSLGHLIYVYQDSQGRYQFYELFPPNQVYHRESSATTIKDFYNFYNELYGNGYSSYTYFSTDSTNHSTIIEKGP